MYLKLGIEQRTENVIVYNGKDYDLSVEKEAEYIRKLFPKALKYVGDWDVWRWVNDPQQMGLYMNNGFNATKPANFDENDDFWMQFYTDDYPECTQTTEVINTGKVIANHEKTQNKYHIEKYGYDAVAVWYPAGSKKLPYKIIALNTAKHSSMVFDSVKNDYEIGIVFTYNEYGTTYSIYRLKLNPEKDIDCSYIAKTYGGGGHHDAAGWTTPTRNLLFLPKKEADEK